MPKILHPLPKTHLIFYLAFPSLMVSALIVHELSCLQGMHNRQIDKLICPLPLKTFKVGELKMSKMDPVIKCWSYKPQTK